MIASLTQDEALEVLYMWRLWARPNQIAPDGAWQNWLILAGRGWGKTRTGGEWINEQVWDRGKRHIALVARTAADARDVMVMGESGLLSSAHPKRRPRYEPTKRRVVWANGAVATMYSAEKPDALRGPQHDVAWCDEPAAWKYPDDTWSNLQFGLRLGDRPQAVLTTTPRPIPLVKELLADPTTVLSRGSTYENTRNLPQSFLQRVRKKYEGTRLGRQEIHAEVLDDNPGALWKRAAMLDAHRVVRAPRLVRVVVAVDPAVSANALSNETGIVAVGLGEDGHAYVLGDYSVSDTPAKWGAAVITAYCLHEADRVVGEVNNGGDLVESNVRTAARDASPRVEVSYKAVRASRGKQTRAEPVAALYEQGRVHHVGSLPVLEDQLCDWDPTTNAPSPDRLDALVWGVTELMLGGAESSFEYDPTYDDEIPRMRI